MNKKFLKLAAIPIALIFCGCSIFPEVKPNPNQQSSSDEVIVQSSEISEEIIIPESSVEESSELEPIDTSKVYDFENKYFAKQLDEKKLRLFTEIYSCASKHKNDVDFALSTNSEELEAVMYLINYDCPELIHLSGDYYPISDQNGEIIGVQLTYVMSDDEYQKNLETVKKFISEMKTELEGKTDIEKEKYVYDYIFYNCVYNDTDTLAGSVYGTLINHVGRCEGFCKSFMWCMREMGIECMCVSGNESWISNSIYAKHSWNIVKIDGEYYHLDVTIDNFKTNPDDENPPNYGFFNVDDYTVASNRTIDNAYISLNVPSCRSMDYNYHLMNGLLIPSEDNPKTIFFEILKNNLVNDKIENVSIKFESEESYKTAAENSDSWMLEFIHTYTVYEYLYTYYYNELSRTITVYAYPEETEDEPSEQISDSSISDNSDEPNSDNQNSFDE